jgi:hypothetical protein
MSLRNGVDDNSLVYFALHFRTIEELVGAVMSQQYIEPLSAVLQDIGSNVQNINSNNPNQLPKNQKFTSSSQDNEEIQLVEEEVKEKHDSWLRYLFWLATVTPSLVFLSDEDSLARLLNSLAEYHRNFVSISTNSFSKLKESLLSQENALQATYETLLNQTFSSFSTTKTRNHVEVEKNLQKLQELQEKVREERQFSLSRLTDSDNCRKHF